MKSYTPIAVVCCGLLAGCAGTSTYGTGKSQEAQLLEDLSGIVTIGSKKKKKRIDYAARPKLVKPPTVAALNPPSETVTTEQGYFPVDPEERRANNISDAPKADERSGEIAGENINRRRRTASTSSENAVQKPAPGTVDVNREQSAAQMLRESVEGREERLAAITEARGEIGAKPRKYLTQPPAEYRTPAQTAAVGKLGSKEVDPTKKARKGIFDFLKRDGRDEVN